MATANPEIQTIIIGPHVAEHPRFTRRDVSPCLRRIIIGDPVTIKAILNITRLRQPKLPLVTLSFLLQLFFSRSLSRANASKEFQKVYFLFFLELAFDFCRFLKDIILHITRVTCWVDYFGSNLLEFDFLKIQFEKSI